MSAITAWIEPRKPTLIAISLGLGTFPLALAAAWALVPAVAAREAAVDRVVFALQLAVAPTLVLHLFLHTLWRVFDTEDAENPFVGGESPRWKINARVFQNSIEQYLLFVPVIVALAARVHPDQLRGVSVLVVTWTVGRLLFWVGYHRPDPRWRAPGMDWTTCSAFLAVAWFVWTLFAA
jgi:uncharacterized membrane protein YecN with MAPEG domain